MAVAVTAPAALFGENTSFFLQLKGETDFKERHNCGNAALPSNALH